MLTSETSADEIIEHHKRTLTNTIQIVDKLKEGTYEKIKYALPAIKIVQVIHIIDEKTIDEAIRISYSVDALLLDSGNPNLKIKELGGTGRVHDWKLSKKTFVNKILIKDNILGNILRKILSFKNKNLI
jgi:phosphoribosylanthranilate isomerase